MRPFEVRQKASRSLLVFLLFMLPGAFPVTAAEPPVSIIVQGIGGEALANVEAALALPPGLVQEGEVNKPWLERFEEKAAAKAAKALEPFGYFTPKIRTSLEAEGANKYVLRVQVEAGQPVRVDRIAVTLEGPGARETSLTSLVAGFPLKRGDVLLQRKYEEAKGAIKARAMDLGYLDAYFSVHQIRVFVAELKAEITLRLDTGPQYFFDETKFEGGGRYSDLFLQRYLAYKPGDVFSYAKLAETHLNLSNSDRFKSVIISPEKQEARDLHVPIFVRLEPSESKRLRIGAGYGTDTGPRVTLHYKDLNMFGTGHEFDTVLNLSQKLQGFAADYIMPDIHDMKSYNELKLNLKREDVTTYTNKLISVEVNRTRSIGKGQLLAIYLRAQKENFEVGLEHSNARIILPGVRISGRRFDNLIRPTDAYRYEVDVHGTHQVLGSNTGLFQIVAEGDKITPLPWRLSLLTRIKAGITFQNDPIEKLPVSMRFFAGGDRSVRGYSYQSLGPKDSAGNVIGGRNILVGSVEIERALFSDWGVAGFYDVGNAFNSLTSITLFQGVGIGVRYYTKIGAIKVDLARRVGVDNPGFRLHFNVGAQF